MVLVCKNMCACIAYRNSPNKMEMRGLLYDGMLWTPPLLHLNPHSSLEDRVEKYMSF